MAVVAPVRRGSWTEATPTTGTSLSIPVPPGIEVGDVLVAAIRNQTAQATDFTSSGWTRQGPTFPGSTTDGRLMGFYAIRVTSGNIASLTGSVTFSCGTSGRMVGGMAAFTGVDPTTLLAGSTTSYAGTLITNGRRAAAFSVSGPCIQLTVGANENTSSNSATPTTTPASHTLGLRSNTGTALPSSRTSIDVYERTFTASGTTSDADVAWVAASGQGAHSIALLGAEESAPPLDVTGTAGVGLAATADVRAVRGPVNVDAVLATPGFTMAHRGNGTGGNTAEHSAFAYLQAANRGYPVLEMSVNRTSDGVWFGLHDQYLDRTSGVTGSIDPTTMTWATLTSTYQIVNGADGVVRPYFRLDDLIAEYGSTHVLMLDPKYRHSSHRSEFLDICEAVGPDHCMVKFYVDNTSLAAAAAARGLKTWGYAYPADLSDPSFSTWASAWTTLGMTYDASSGDWATILGYGKPVIAHIAASQANYDTAIAAGASGVQCGASQTITAVGPIGELYSRTGAATVNLEASATATASGGTVVRTGVATLAITGTAEAIASGGTVDRAGTAGLVITAAATATASGGIVTRTGTATIALTLTGEVAGGAVVRTGSATIAIDATATASVSGGTVTRAGSATFTIGATATATATGGTIVRTGTAVLYLTAVGMVGNPTPWPEAVTATIDTHPLAGTIDTHPLTATLEA